MPCTVLGTENRVINEEDAGLSPYSKQARGTRWERRSNILQSLHFFIWKEKQTQVCLSFSELSCVCLCLIQSRKGPNRHSGPFSVVPESWLRCQRFPSSSVVWYLWTLANLCNMWNAGEEKHFKTLLKDTWAHGGTQSSLLVESKRQRQAGLDGHCSLCKQLFSTQPATLQ